MSHVFTAHHVEKMVRNYRRGKRLEALNAGNRRHALRELSWYVDDDGWVFKGRFSPEQGALIAKALERLAEAYLAAVPKTPPPGARRGLWRAGGAGQEIW